MSAHSWPMTSLSEFTTYVLPSVHNAPEDIVQRYVLLAAIELCRRVPALKMWTVIDSVGGVSDYALDTGNPSLQVRGLSQVWVKGITLSRLSAAPGPSGSSTFPHMRGYWLTLPNVLDVFPVPAKDTPGGIEVEVLMMPHQTAEELPTQIFDRYAEALADGALSRLLLMQTADWKDVQAAGIHLKRWKLAMQSALLDVERGGDVGPSQAQGRRWA